MCYGIFTSGNIASAENCDSQPPVPKAKQGRLSQDHCKVKVYSTAMNTALGASYGKVTVLGLLWQLKCSDSGQVWSYSMGMLKATGSFYIGVCSCAIFYPCLLVFFSVMINIIIKQISHKSVF